jgi:predicted RNase H-like nuclease (RuvC/YqgF family)
MKEQIGEIRPGELCIFEVLDNGKERYLCRFKTGKNRNGKLIAQDIKKQVKKLNKIYNQDYLNAKMSEYSKMQSNLLHGIELMDMSKVDPYVFAKHVIEKQEVVSHLRRQYKSDLYDARTLENDLKELQKLINKITSSITNLRQYKAVTDSNNPSQVQIEYLEALGIDVGAYCHNANPEEVLPIENLIKSISKEVDND